MICRSVLLRRCPWCTKRKARGFTLIELIVTVAVLGVLAALAAPSFNEAILNNRLTSYANNFVASATLARSEAIKRNAVVTLCRSANGTACTGSGGWQQGWIVFNDKNGDGILDDTDPSPDDETLIQRQQALSPDYQLTGDFYSIDFQPVGAGVIQACLTLIRATPTPGSQERIIRVNSTGRATVSRTEICP